MTKLVFFGSSEFSVIILQKILTLPDFNLSLVVTKADKAVGRDQTITKNPVAQFAADHRLPLLQVENFDENCKLKIKNFQAELGLCVAFGPPFFDQEMIDIFPHKIVNIHPSPLPKYRGATPGPWQIINGETTSAVTFFQIDSLPDHGPLITQIPFDIGPAETSQTFYEKAFTLASENLNSILTSYIINPESFLTPQDHSQKSYYPKFTKDTAKINWSKPADYLERFIRAMLPWPIAWTIVSNQQNQDFKMKIFSFNTKPIEVQIEGKKPTLWSEISKYYSLKKSP
jgi:methionyl-tRNA formyltransferase